MKNNYKEIKESSNKKIKKIKYYHNNKLIKEENYYLNELNGKTIEYNLYGNIKKENNYKKNLLDGLSKIYNYEEKTILYEYYKNNKLIKTKIYSFEENKEKEYKKQRLKEKFEDLINGEFFGYIILIILVLFFISIMKILGIF